MKKILFIPSGSNHVVLFAPIFNILKKKSNALFLTEGSYKNEGAEKSLTSLDIPFQTFDELKIKDPTAFLKKEGINVIVIGNDIDVIPQWFVNSAKELGIPSVLIEDGLLFNFNTPESRFTNKLNPIFNRTSRKLLQLSIKLRIQNKYKKITYGEAGCDQIHVWGATAKSYLLKKGINSHRILISGNTKMDSFNFHESSNLLHVETKKIVLYAPTGLSSIGFLPKDIVFNLVENLCKVITSFHNLQLIIKPHPNENPKFYHEIIQQFDSVSISHANINSLIEKSSFVISNLSTTSVESLSRKKPVIIFLPNIEHIVDRDSFPRIFIEKNIFLHATDSDSLREQISKILDNSFVIPWKEAKKMVVDYLGITNGTSSNTISNAILKLIE